ncbi:MAG: hypothetical protein U9P14_06570 [Gemmatimonadota bacterium]|nr:hypothetical protein [Gemmatimonadota bacterium]
MRFTRNRFFLHFLPMQAAAVLTLLLAASPAPLSAGEPPAHLTILPDSGLIILDNDTLSAVSGPITMEIPPGKHTLRFFPLHTADSLWVHRYIDYPFTLGSQGRRTIDLGSRRVFSVRTEPPSAVLEHRGRFLGRTPGDYLFLTGAGDSLVVKMEGFHTRSIHLDRMLDYGTELFLTLERDESIDYRDQFGADDEYRSIFRELLSPDLMLSLGAGAGLITAGVLFNREADKYYERYLHYIGSDIRENAFSKARRNERLSRASLIAGDAALGLFGYLVLRRYLLKSSRPGVPGRKHPRLSFKASTAEAAFSYEF